MILQKRIFINSDGNEVDRILGFYPADQYLDMVTNIHSQFVSAVGENRSIKRSE